MSFFDNDRPSRSRDEARCAARVEDTSTTQKRRKLRPLSSGLQITIESMNARLRKVTRNRGQFPSEQAAPKVLDRAVRNLEEFRGRNVGTRSSGWKQALQAFTIYFEGRISTP
jgi:transposase-like protein